jgi:hypothetical protein
VPVEETVRSFKEIIEGKHDDIPERAFLLKGTIEEVVEAARGSRDVGPTAGAGEAEGEGESGEGDSGQAESGEDESGEGGSAGAEGGSGEGDGEE